MRKLTQHTLMVFLLLSLLNVTQVKAVNNTYEEDLKYLFQINGSETSFKESIQAMFVHMKSQESDVPVEYWKEAEIEYMHSSVNELIQMLIPIYKKNLNHEDVKAMIVFYESEAGKRIANKVPNISIDTMHASMSWAQTVAMRIKEDISNKGFKIRLPFTP